MNQDQTELVRLNEESLKEKIPIMATDILADEATYKRVPVVWLINEGGHDYTSLEKFGRTLPITKGSVNPFNMDRQIVHIGLRLEHAKVEDYLAISGLPILNAVVVAMWLMRFHKVNLLQWSMRREAYLPVILSRSVLNKFATNNQTPAE